nr:MAG TPA: SprT-like family protein [Caudoviricetes sp.]
MDMIDNNVFDEDLTEIARILSIHNIGVKYNSKLGNTVFGETVIDDNGKATIELNPILIQRLSTHYASRAFIHEIVHAITDNALFSPSNLYERSF